MGEVKENVEGAEVVRVVDSMRGGMGLIAGYSGCVFPPRILEGAIDITVMGESVVVRTGNAETLNVISLDDTWATSRRLVVCAATLNCHASFKV